MSGSGPLRKCRRIPGIRRQIPTAHKGLDRDSGRGLRHRSRQQRQSGDVLHSLVVRPETKIRRSVFAWCDLLSKSSQRLRRIDDQRAVDPFTHGRTLNSLHYTRLPIRSSPANWATIRHGSIGRFVKKLSTNLLSRVIVSAGPAPDSLSGIVLAITNQSRRGSMRASSIFRVNFTRAGVTIAVLSLSLSVAARLRRGPGRRRGRRRRRRNFSTKESGDKEAHRPNDSQ